MFTGAGEDDGAGGSSHWLTGSDVDGAALLDDLDEPDWLDGGSDLDTDALFM